LTSTVSKFAILEVPALEPARPADEVADHEAEPGGHHDHGDQASLRVEQEEVDLHLVEVRDPERDQDDRDDGDDDLSERDPRPRRSVGFAAASSRVLAGIAGWAIVVAFSSHRSLRDRGAGILASSSP